MTRIREEKECQHWYRIVGFKVHSIITGHFGDKVVVRLVVYLYHFFDHSVAGSLITGSPAPANDRSTQSLNTWCLEYKVRLCRLGALTNKPQWLGWGTQTKIRIRKSTATLKCFIIKFETAGCGSAERIAISTVAGGSSQERHRPMKQVSLQKLTFCIQLTSSALFDDCGLESLGAWCRCKERWQCERDNTSKTQGALPYRYGGWSYWTSERLELVT